MDSTSERKGGPHKKKRINLKIGEESNEKLIFLTQSSGLKKRFIVEFLIDLGHKYGFLKKGWKKRLAESLNLVDAESSRARREERGGDCKALAMKGVNENMVFYCVWNRPEKPPLVRDLGKEEVQESKCRACRRTEDIKREISEKDEEIRVLEDKIQMKAKTTRKVPVCNKGAILSQEGTAFRSCPKSSIPVSVATYCKVLSGGLPCALFAEIELAEGPL